MLRTAVLVLWMMALAVAITTVSISATGPSWTCSGFNIVGYKDGTASGALTIGGVAGVFQGNVRIVDAVKGQPVNLTASGYFKPRTGAQVRATCITKSSKYNSVIPQSTLGFTVLDGLTGRTLYTSNGEQPITGYVAVQYK